MRFIKSILNSYSVVFFSDKLFFAGILLIISFFDYFAGLCGLVSVITSYLIAENLGFDKQKIEKGYYGFNSLLAGLGIGLQYEAHWVILVITVLTSIFAFLVTVSLENVLGKYMLPFLSLPFLIAYWIVTIAGRDFQFIGLSGRGIYFLNDMYILGGHRIISAYEWWNRIDFIFSLKLYFLSLGAIFFQYNIIAGIFIAVGILFISRISFSLSLIGFYSAYFFYQFLEINITESSYAYIGFNFILASIAIGGFFLIPSWRSYLWAIILMPVTALLTFSFSSIFAPLHTHIYSLPFNLIVILFLFALKSRVHKKDGLSEVYVRQSSPENNLYSYLNKNYRFRNYKYYPLRLPFFGEWNVSQAHNGNITHKDKWRHAWDFVIRDSGGKTYRNYGSDLEDYYCYNKAVLAPADGFVEDVIDGIPDNNIRDVNIENNWGNTIILRHGEGFYSKMCHIKPGSFKVRKGEWVKTGQLIALCGSSGRSPEPHLHFQLQSVPFVEGPTIDYPFSQYIQKTTKGISYKAYDKPLLNDIVSNVELNPVLKEGFHFIPGRVLKFETNCKGKKKIIEWEVYTDIYNYSYIYCKDSKSLAYFNNDGRVFYFYDFTGSKKSLLYYFFLAAYKVPLGYYQDMSISDTPALNLVYSRAGLFFQDFTAPFFLFLKSIFKVTYANIDDVLHTNSIILKSEIENYFLNIKTGKRDFTIVVTRNGIEKIEIKLKNKIITANCLTEHA